MKTLFDTLEFTQKRIYEKPDSSKDWVGNYQSTVAVNGFANLREGEREGLDLYCTEPKALEMLLDLEVFGNVWECACGLGHLSAVLRKRGVLGRESDIHKRYEHEVLNFLYAKGEWKGDIITNPPYKYSLQFIYKALELIETGRKVAMFLPIRYLESRSRRELFDSHPPLAVYVSSGRLCCSINGKFDGKEGSAVSYAWFVWRKGYKGITRLKWFN